MAQEQHIIMDISIDYDKDKAYKNHNLGSNEAVLIGTFKDKSVSEFLKNAGKNISFSFYSK